jgi:hypothetical protein
LGIIALLEAGAATDEAVKVVGVACHRLGRCIENELRLEPVFRYRPSRCLPAPRGLGFAIHEVVRDQTRLR